MIKYVAYCRRSIEQEEKQALSIEAQIAELKEFALKEKLEVVEFLTESKTAKVPGREVFGCRNENTRGSERKELN